MLPHPPLLGGAYVAPFGVLLFRGHGTLPLLAQWRPALAQQYAPLVLGDEPLELALAPQLPSHGELYRAPPFAYVPFALAFRAQQRLVAEFPRVPARE